MTRSLRITMLLGLSASLAVAASFRGGKILVPQGPGFNGFTPLGIAAQGTAQGVSELQVCRVPGGGTNKMFLTVVPSAASKAPLAWVGRVLWHNFTGGPSECIRWIDPRGEDSIRPDMIYIGGDRYPENVTVLAVVSGIPNSGVGTGGFSSRTVVAPGGNGPSGWVQVGISPAVNSVKVCRVPGAGTNKIYITADPQQANDKGIIRTLWHNNTGGHSECFKLIDRSGADGIDTRRLFVGASSYSEHVTVFTHHKGVATQTFLRPYFDHGSWLSGTGNAFQCAGGIVGPVRFIDGFERWPSACQLQAGRYIGDVAAEMFVGLTVQVPPGQTVNSKVGIRGSLPLGLDLNAVNRILSANPNGGRSDIFEWWSATGMSSLKYRDLAIATQGAGPLVVAWVRSNVPYPIGWDL